MPIKQKVQIVEEMARLSFTDAGLKSSLLRTFKFAFICCAYMPEINDTLKERKLSLLRYIVMAASLVKSNAISGMALESLISLLECQVLQWVDGHLEQGRIAYTSRQDQQLGELLKDIFCHAIAVQAELDVAEIEKQLTAHSGQVIKSIHAQLVLKTSTTEIEQ